MITLTPASGGLALRTPFDRAFVEQFKYTIPSAGRRWDAASRVWVVAPQYGQQVADLCQQWFGVVVRVPATAATVTVESRLLRVEYIGAAKDRGTESSAYGWVNGGWNVIFPEAVLRSWFDDSAPPGEHATLFAVLMVPQTATPDEIKKAYRGMAKRWHPDVNRDPDAHEVFKRVNLAYEILSDPLRRKKYLAGLAMAASAAKPTRPAYNPLQRDSNYRPPVRCGWIMAEGQETLGRFLVCKVQQWADVTDGQGRVMVTSWPVGATTFETNWI